MMLLAIFPFALFSFMTLGRPVKRVAFGGDFNNGDGCIAAKALADSIQSNVDLQRGEQASLAKVKNVVSQPAVDMLSFLAAKQQLLDFVNAGIAVRSNNQLIAPTGSAAISGLAIVQNAQAQELNLATSLAGNANDLAIIAQLEQDFAGGVQQNEQNAIDKRQIPAATETSTSTSTTTTIATATPSTTGLYSEDSRNHSIADTSQMGWLFGAILITMTVVTGAILFLRRKRHENLAKADRHELKDWEDAYAV